ncbi:MAG: O-antigen ligase family protein, partial [Pirellulales bacterium]
MIDTSTAETGRLNRYGPNTRFVTVTWIAYLALAPVAWLPGIPHSAFTAAKNLVFLLAVIFTWAYARRRSVPRGLAGPVGMALVAATSVFAVAQASGLSTALRGTIEIVVAFGILWTLYVFERDIAPVWSVAAAAAVIQGVLSLLIVAAFLGWIDLQSPDALNANTIQDTGLGGWRTGWSNSVAMFVPFALALVMRPGKVVVRLIGVGAVAATLLGQLISGGRAGVFVTLLSVLLMVTFAYGIPGIVIGLTAVFTGAYLLLSGFAARFGIDRFDEPFGDIDDLSSGRLELLRFGVEKVGERPLIGHGNGQPVVALANGDTLEIHNIWLRIAAEGGIFLVVSFAAVVLSILGKAVDVLWRATLAGSRAPIIEAAALLASLVGGIVISMVEPNIFFGTMHASAIWW